jgi:hypothetical protein
MKAKTLLIGAGILAGVIALIAVVAKAAGGIKLQPGRNDITWLGGTQDTASLFNPIDQYINVVYLSKGGVWYHYYPNQPANTTFTQIETGDGISIDVSVPCTLPGQWKYSWPNIYPTR